MIFNTDFITNLLLLSSNMGKHYIILIISVMTYIFGNIGTELDDFKHGE